MFDLLSHNDAVLLVRARNGCKEALAELVSRYEPALRKVVRRTLDRRCRCVADVDDVMQELRLALLRANIAPAVFAGAKTLLNYFSRAAANQAKKVNRHWLCTCKRGVGGSCLLARLPSKAPAPGQYEEAIEEVCRSYFRLPEPISTVYFMLVIGGTAAQIADGLGESKSSIYRTIALAEQQVRGYFARKA